MSQLMLDDEMTINDINPFVNCPPGAWSRPYKYASNVTNIIEQEPEFLTGDNRGVEFRCPLNRPLYPERNIDKGFWSLCKETVKKVDQGTFFVPFIIIILLVILFISYME
jgi:hypothetical protein